MDSWRIVKTGVPVLVCVIAGLVLLPAVAGAVSQMGAYQWFFSKTWDQMSVTVVTTNPDGTTSSITTSSITAEQRAEIQSALNNPQNRTLRIDGRSIRQGDGTYRNEYSVSVSLGGNKTITVTGTNENDYEGGYGMNLPPAGPGQLPGGSTSDLLADWARSHGIPAIPSNWAIDRPLLPAPAIRSHWPTPFSSDPGPGGLSSDQDAILNPFLSRWPNQGVSPGPGSIPMDSQIDSGIQRRFSSGRTGNEAGIIESPQSLLNNFL